MQSENRQNEFSNVCRDLLVAGHRAELCRLECTILKLRRAYMRHDWEAIEGLLVEFEQALNGLNLTYHITLYAPKLSYKQGLQHNIMLGTFLFEPSLT